MGGVLNPVPFVDTNMRRVLHRLFFGVDAPAPSATEGEIMRLAAALVPRSKGWKWNQALMELGALVCKARKPRCGSCPVKGACRAQPKIAEALAGLPRGTKKEAGYRYEDTNRYLRGRVLARLRDAPEEGVTVRELGAGIREGFDEEGASWIYGVMRSLENDGLATVSRRLAHITDIATVERAAYGAEENDERCDPGETRVRLP